jgi:hypothetical protein
MWPGSVFVRSLPAAVRTRRGSSRTSKKCQVAYSDILSGDCHTEGCLILRLALRDERGSLEAKSALLVKIALVSQLVLLLSAGAASANPLTRGSW